MPDNTTIMNFIGLSQKAATQGRSKDDVEQILYGGDQNLASQMIISLSQALNLISANLQQTAGLSIHDI
jgi:hypothetical protein